MPFNLEETLKAAGYTDADIEANKVLLTDPKFRGAIESAYATKEKENEALVAETHKWDQAYTAKLEEAKKIDQERINARSENASLLERLKMAEEAGFLKRAEAPNGTPPPDPAKPEAFDPKKHNLPTWEDVHRLVALEGEAIAMARDLASEYQELTGKDMLDYSMVDGEGRSRRGMQALLYEARAAKQPIDQFVANKFDFAGKRAARSEAQRKAQEEAIRKDEREKVIKEHVHPELRPLMPSTQPFIPKRERAGANGQPKQPWEIPASERRASRLQHAYQTEINAKGMVQ